MNYTRRELVEARIAKYGAGAFDESKIKRDGDGKFAQSSSQSPDSEHNKTLRTRATFAEWSERLIGKHKSPKAVARAKAEHAYAAKQHRAVADSYEQSGNTSYAEADRKIAESHDEAAKKLDSDGK